ncbi:MAG: hypothetical protein AAGG51_11905 [Cyanobacteria bacterium P01_G01_bin.54]
MSSQTATAPIAGFPLTKGNYWAHLKRDLTAIAERTGLSPAIGAALLARQRRLFRRWYRLREGTLSRELLIAAVEHLRVGFIQVLEETASLTIFSSP